MSLKNAAAEGSMCLLCRFLPFTPVPAIFRPLAALWPRRLKRPAPHSASVSPVSLSLEPSARTPKSIACLSTCSATEIPGLPPFGVRRLPRRSYRTGQSYCSPLLIQPPASLSNRRDRLPPSAHPAADIPDLPEVNYFRFPQ